jgi:hypothetical protein
MHPPRTERLTDDAIVESPTTIGIDDGDRSTATGVTMKADSIMRLQHFSSLGRRDPRHR